MKACVLQVLCLASCASWSEASYAEAGQVNAALKLTVGDYQYQDDQGQDVNLRWQHGNSHVWLGHYHDGSFGSQDRIGADTSIDISDNVSLQPSVQAATGDFVGGSLNAQIGHQWYGLVGWGRTNLKPYFNLNFDPNDAVTLGAGHQFDNGQNWSCFVVHDDRLHTGQTDWHLTARIPIDGERLSLDLMRKTGESDVGYIRTWSLSVGWDFPSWFMRLARDPKQNFTGQDAWRVSGGVRF
ncbi:MAG: hypothetical protein KGI91_00790 [Burkholderiales bacterium]|nr:hypothetical protein [Burkholderiales bacterium]MDE2075594.1 hypothetical protein [Burkholderiales bacterium]MDE2432890.1 hypothetical protein [Burkholderiales bacterium]